LSKLEPHRDGGRNSRLQKKLFAFWFDQQPAQTVNLQNADACAFPPRDPVVAQTVLTRAARSALVREAPYLF